MKLIQKFGTLCSQVLPKQLYVQVDMKHPTLEEPLKPIQELYRDVRRKALMRLEYEGLHAVEAGATPGARFFNDPARKAKPRQNLVKRTFKSGPRRSLYKLKTLLSANKYRTDLSKAALRRASAVLRSQRPQPAKKQKVKKPE